MKTSIKRDFLFRNILSRVVQLQVGLNDFVLRGFELGRKRINLGLSNPVFRDQRTVIVKRNWFDFGQWFLSNLSLLRIPFKRLHSRQWAQIQLEAKAEQAWFLELTEYQTEFIAKYWARLCSSNRRNDRLGDYLSLLAKYKRNRNETT